MFSNIAIDQVLNNVIRGLLTTALNEEVHNPYLKAILSPIADAFSQGIVSGASPEQSALNAAERSGFPADQLEKILRGIIMDQRTVSQSGRKASQSRD